MRLKAAPAALGLLSCLLLFCPGQLLAKPTRTLARSANRRLIAAQPTSHSSRDRANRKTSDAYSNAHAYSRSHDSARTSSSFATRTSARTQTPTRESRHTRAWEQAQRERAAHSAILAADRAASRATRAHSYIATNNQPVSSSRLANVNGVLRSESVTPPLRSVEEDAIAPLILPVLSVSSLYDSHGRLIIPPPLYGSREILLHQNQMADHDGLDRIRDDEDLLDLRRENKLVALPENDTLRVDYRLPENRRYSRPWTAAFLSVLAHDYYSSFHSPLQVDSAVRTVTFQQHLTHTNGNAAPSTGDTASPHLTGQAVDIAKGGLSRIQIAWLRTYLQPLIDQGKIDVEEEFQQACFHISVYKDFLPTTAPHLSVATARQLPQESTPGGPSY